MTALWRACFLVYALALASCSAGIEVVPVSGGGAAGPVPDPPEPPAPVAHEPEVQPDHIVLQFDVTGDENVDLVTVDLATSPYTIVAVLEVGTSGALVDRTGDLAGLPIDPSVAEAVTNHLATSFELNTTTRIEVVDSTGATVNVTIFE